jgi:CubicO group peptidase (beta-lactamase class C family)
MPLPEETLATLCTLVDNACSDPKTTIPGAVVVIVDKEGNELFAHAAGKRGAESSEPMTLDTIFWIASCTKLLVGIACMQLVEQGKFSLDDESQIEELCPELKDLKVLKEDGSYEEKKKAITLRMLLTHTAGFGYTFFNERLRDWSYPAGVDEFSGRVEDVTSTPLLFQPGEGWEYGVRSTSLFPSNSFAIPLRSRMNSNKSLRSESTGPA